MLNHKGTQTIYTKGLILRKIREDDYKDMEIGVEKKESDEVTIDNIEKEKMILTDMLLSGNKDFPSKLEGFENFCNELSKAKQKFIIQQQRFL